MTALSGPILFNNASGSDTAASGVGPSTAVSGTGASLNSTSTVTLSADTPDLSGVSAGDLLWVDTSSGRQFSVIASVDDGADTVTCDDAFSVTESGRNWGIGGKRKTLDNADSRVLFLTDAKQDWIVELEDDQTLTTALDWDAAGTSTQSWTTIRGATGAIRKITQSGSGANVLEIDDANGRWFRLKNIKLEHSHATNGHGIHQSGDATLCIEQVEIGDATNSLDRGWNRAANSPNLIAVDSWIHDCDSDGINSSNTGSTIHLQGVVIDNCGGSGVTGFGRWTLAFCNIYDNTSRGCSWDFNGVWAFVSQCTIHSNGGDGIKLNNGNDDPTTIIGNNITANGGYGINGHDHRAYIDYNNFGTGATANTSGAVNNVTQGDNTQAVDPGYTDAANGDFSVGTNVKALSYPGAFLDGNSTGYLDIGAVQREEPAGGGGGTTVPQGIHPIEAGITA